MINWCIFVCDRKLTSKKRKLFMQILPIYRLIDNIRLLYGKIQYVSINSNNVNNLYNADKIP